VTERIFSSYISNERVGFEGVAKNNKLRNKTKKGKKREKITLDGSGRGHTFKQFLFFCISFNYWLPWWRGVSNGGFIKWE